jgi:hypothetical protein
VVLALGLSLVTERAEDRIRLEGSASKLFHDLDAHNKAWCARYQLLLPALSALAVKSAVKAARVAAMWATLREAVDLLNAFQRHMGVDLHACCGDLGPEAVASVYDKLVGFTDMVWLPSFPHGRLWLTVSSHEMAKAIELVQLSNRSVGMTWHGTPFCGGPSGPPIPARLAHVAPPDPPCAAPDRHQHLIAFGRPLSEVGDLDNWIERSQAPVTPPWPAYPMSTSAFSPSHFQSVKPKARHTAFSFVPHGTALDFT